MIITGLVGALVASSYKWGYFVFALISLFGVAYNVLWTARRFSHRIGGRAYKTFLLVGCWTLFLWFLYPISWGLSEGGNRIGAVGEAVFYGVLDILSKVVFTIFLLIGHAGIDPATLGVAIRDYDEELYGEKTHPQQGSSAVANTSAHAGVNEPSHIGHQGPGTGSGLEGQSQAYASTANASGMPQHAPPAR
jgi:bacteriorhodopsin